MPRFRGSYEYSIDAKNRVNIPAKFRKAMNPEADETFVIARGPNNTLRIYPADVWTVFENDLLARPETPETVMLKRLLYNMISDAKADGQGRIMLTQKQVDLAEIRKNVVLVGAGDYIEAWSAERYAEAMSATDDFDAVFFRSEAEKAK
jgi:MraZ protein